MAKYWLTILQGPNKGTEYDLEDDKIVVGRHPGCNININDSEISRKHFLLVKKGGDYWIEDLNSTNQTVVNGRPASASYRLRNNSKINLGANVTLVFRKEEPKPTTEMTKPSKVEKKVVKEAVPVIKRPRKKKPVREVIEKPKRNWWAWGCFGFLVILILTAVAVLYYIDANFLWCEIFGEWLPGCW